MPRSNALPIYRHASALLVTASLVLPAALFAAPTATPRPAVKPGASAKPASPKKPAASATNDAADEKAVRAALDDFLAAWEREDAPAFAAAWSMDVQKLTKIEQVARDEFVAYDDIRLQNRDIWILPPVGTGEQRQYLVQVLFDKSWKDVVTGYKHTQTSVWGLRFQKEKGRWKIVGAADPTALHAADLEKKNKAEFETQLQKTAPRLIELIGLYWIDQTNTQRKNYKLEEAARFLDLADGAAQALKKKEPKNRDLEGWVLSTRGLLTFDLSRYEEAAKFDTQALEVFEAVGDDDGRASAYSNRGNAWNNDGRYDESLADYERSLQVSRVAMQAKPEQRAIWREKEATALFNLAGALDTLDRADEAMVRYRDSLAIWKELGTSNWQARILGQIGRVLLRLGKTDEALHAFQDGLAVLPIPADLSQTDSDTAQYVLVLQDALGDLYLAAGRYDDAKKAYEAAMTVAKNLKYTWRMARLTTKLDNVRHLANYQDERPELALNLGHTNYVGAISVAPNGKTWVSGGWDGSVKIWDAATGKLLQTLLGHNERVFDVDYSPDSQTIASVSDDSTVKLWSVEDGALQRTLVGHDQGVLGVSFSADGNTIASSSRDGKILLWDAKTGAVRRRLQGHVGSSRALAYSPDGSILASVGDDKSVRIWDAKSGALLRGLKGHTDLIFALVFSPDGSVLASGSDDKTVRLWNPQTGALLKTFTVADRVHAVAFSADGKRLAIAHGGGDQVWDIAEGKMLYALSGTHDYSTWDIADAPPAPGGTEYFIGGSKDKTLKVWNAANGDLQRTLPPQSNYIYWLGYIDDNKTLAGSIVSDGVARGLMLWDTQTGALRRTVAPPNAARGGLGITRDGQKIVVIDDKICEFRIHDAQTGKLLWSGKHDKTIIGSTYTKDYKIFASCSEDQTVKLWDMQTGKLLATIRSAEPIADADISPDAGRVVFYGKSGSIVMQDVATRKVIFKVDPSVTGGNIPNGPRPYAISYLQNGCQLLTLSPLRLWDAQTGKLLQTFSTDTIGTASVSTDGAYIASTRADNTDNTVRVWDAATGQLKWTLSGHTGHVDKLGFSPDGKRLASTGYDNTIKVWSVSTGRLLATMIPVPDENSGEIMRAAPGNSDATMSWLTVTPDGYYTCSVGADYAIKWRFGNRLVPFSDFEETFRRRDMVRQSLAELNARGGPILTFARVAPAIRFLSPSAQATVSGTTLHIEVEATDDGEVDEVQFFTNGANVPQAAAKIIPSSSKAITIGDKAIPADHKISRTFTADLPLPSEEADVLVRAVVYDKDRNSAQNTLLVHRDDARTTVGDLHALLIGVSRYRNSKYNLQFAADDARALAESLKSQRGKNYEDVQVTVLTDEQASAEGIRAALESLKKNTKTSDTVMVFLSGHGVQQGGEFYFAPFGIVADDIENTALPWSDILNPLKDVQGKKIVLADACHSGARVGDEAATGEQILDASRRHKGIVVMASSSGDRYSYEIGELKHGAFTVALLEALDGKADNIKADGKLTLPELESYLAERTSSLTQGRQQPHLVAQDFNPQSALALTK